MNTNIDNLVRENIKKLKPYSSARSEFKANNAILLDANESWFETEVNRYPDPFQWDLKNLIAQKLKLDAESIFLGNGSDEILDLLIRAFCNPRKDNIIMFSPTYGMYKVLADINEIEVRITELNQEFDVDYDKTIDLVDHNTKLIFACSPNNPTGNLLSKDVLVKLLRNFNGVLVVDEAYIDFANQSGFLGLIQEKSNLFVLRTMSKSWAAAGIRLGIGFSNKEIISVLNKIKPPYNINALTLKKAQQLLNLNTIMQDKVEQTITIRKAFENSIKHISIIKKVYKSDSNFVLIKVINAEEVYLNLLAKGTVVRRFSDNRLNDCIRISIGNENEMQVLIKELKLIDEQLNYAER